MNYELHFKINPKFTFKQISNAHHSSNWQFYITNQITCNLHSSKLTSYIILLIGGFILQTKLCTCISNTTYLIVTTNNTYTKIYGLIILLIHNRKQLLRYHGYNNTHRRLEEGVGGLRYLTPLSTKFQLYRHHSKK
jgi:hypothetical protein